MKIPKVSINILGYNSEKYLKLCLKSVFWQTYPNLEIIYIDNKSSDNSVTLVHQLSRSATLPIKIIVNKKNLGYAGGHNVGINKSTGEYILCLNPDIILDKNYIKNIIDLFQENKKAAVIGGKLLKSYFDNSEIKKTNIIDSIGLQISKSHRVVERGGLEKDKGQYGKIEEMFGISGAASVFRRRALDDISDYKDGKKVYFDEDFFAYKEDIDICWRLRHQGYTCLYQPNSVAYHNRWETGGYIKKNFKETLRSHKTRSSQINYYSYRNHLYLILKNEFLINCLIYAPWIFSYELKKLIYILLLERKTLKGLFDFINSLPLTLKKRHAILSTSKLKPKNIRNWLT